MKPLPRSLDEIGGLRAARWIRESTAGQYDRYGPASQREQQDRFIDRHGLVDTGLVFQVAHSGTTVWRSSTMSDDARAAQSGSLRPAPRRLLRPVAAQPAADARAPGGRPSPGRGRPRDVRPAHPSSDPHDWDELVAESAGAERYSRRLSERITDGYAAKFEQRADPGGHAARLPTPRSRRTPSRSTRTTIGIAVGLFERYALGNVSATQLAGRRASPRRASGCILMNPLYNGWVRRRSRTGGVAATSPWRADPPVSDELWARVEDVRRAKTRGGGPRNRGGSTCSVASWSACADGESEATGRSPTAGTGNCIPSRAPRGVARHAWPMRRGRRPLLAQLAAIRLGDATIAAVVATLGSSERPVAIERGRIERRIRELALEHAAGTIDDDYLPHPIAALRGQRDAVERTRVLACPPSGRSRGCARSARRSRRADHPAERAELVHAIYERIIVAGPRFVSVRLTAAAHAHGLALALPERLLWRARQDSNLRPSAPEADALSTELQARGSR